MVLVKIHQLMFAKMYKPNTELWTSFAFRYFAFILGQLHFGLNVFIGNVDIVMVKFGLRL